MLETEPRIKTERPKLSPEGKPIIWVTQSSSSVLLECDLLPFVRTAINFPIERDGFKQEFAELLIRRARSKMKWLADHPEPQYKEKQIDMALLIRRVKSSRTDKNIVSGFEFIKR